MCTSRCSFSPAYDPAAGARRDDAVLGRQTYWTNKGIKGDWRGQLQQSNVIIVVFVIVFIMNFDVTDTHHDFLVISSPLCPLSQVNK